MHTTIYSGAVVGVDGLVVEVEVDISRGIPSFSIVGMPNTAVRESRERVTAAIKNSGWEFPLQRITVNLAPADLRKEGAAFDLAIAVGILVASEQVRGELNDTLFLGELALDGALRSVPGVLPVLMHARAGRYQRAVVPLSNWGEAVVVDGIEVAACAHLRALVGSVITVDDDDADEGAAESYTESDETPVIHIKPRDQVGDICDESGGEGEESVREPNTGGGNQPPGSRRAPNVPRGSERGNGLDMRDVKGQEAVKRALLVAAAGGHHVLLSGPPGAGKTMLARRFSSILPPLDRGSALETTKIYSIVGLLNGRGVISERPFRAPHHSASDAGLIGGGSVPRPGEVTLAHNGILFLDELPEFKRHVLETLREPLEDGCITISRARSAVTFPARFQLVAAMNPCPCGYHGTKIRQCRCSPAQIENYRARISGPLLDRISIHARVQPVDLEALESAPDGESSEALRERVMKAWARQRERLGDGRSNALISEGEFDSCCELSASAASMLSRAVTRMRLSARARAHTVRVARTIADLDHCDVIEVGHIQEAVQYRDAGAR